MKLGFGRVLPGPGGDDATTQPRVVRRPSSSRLPVGRVAPAAVVEASAQAREIVARAEASAAELVRKAEGEAAHVRLAVEVEARAEAASRIAAHAVALRAREDEALERNLDRVVEVARVLAERLLGEALALEPGRVVALARRALDEARGARRVTIVAHPDDARLIEQALLSAQAGSVADVVADAERRRGSLRLETDIGVLDADIAPQLDRLLPKLREALGHG